MLSRQYLWRTVEHLCALGCVIACAALAGVFAAAALSVALVVAGRGVGSRDTPYLLPASVDPPTLAPVDTLAR